MVFGDKRTPVFLVYSAIEKRLWTGKAGEEDHKHFQEAAC